MYTVKLPHIMNVLITANLAYKLKNIMLPFETGYVFDVNLH